MALEVQHYLVYAVVGFSIYKLLSPVFFWALNKYEKWKNPNLQKDFYSCYSGICSKCSIKEHE
ncbi:MAG: hypothetical protein N3A69_01950 [Leptospiraceae bacterium]|nr:hypothetical protein [Leptospiraceae bacterium]